MFEGEPWDRQSTESAKAFEAFCLYRDAGASRSIKAVAEKLGKSSGLLERWSRQNRWQERTREWDRFLDEQKQAAKVQAIREMHERHAAIGREMSEKAMRALQTLEQGTMKPNEIVAMIKTACEIERLAMESEVKMLANEDSAGDVLIYLPDNGRDAGCG